ncbi:MAG: VOC family protein [Clostridia bacterium]|nr:VOC family protein [Clostridia bacterium]
MLKNAGTSITQIGFVIRDGEKVKQGMKALFGLSPAKTRLTCEDDARRYHGAPGDFQAELLYYQFGALELEFILPLHGQSIWQDFLDLHGEGLHHIQIAAADCDLLSAELSALGVSVIQEGASVSNIPGAKWQYYDLSPALPFILEAFDGNAKAAALEAQEGKPS